MYQKTGLPIENNNTITKENISLKFVARSSFFDAVLLLE
jgi:hypothetical protein